MGYNDNFTLIHRMFLKITFCLSTVSDRWIPIKSRKFQWYSFNICHHANNGSQTLIVHRLTMFRYCCYANGIPFSSNFITYYVWVECIQFILLFYFFSYFKGSISRCRCRNWYHKTTNSDRSNAKFFMFRWHIHVCHHQECAGSSEGLRYRLQLISYWSEM